MADWLFHLRLLFSPRLKIRYSNPGILSENVVSRGP
jgi:hypothetical protein